MFWNPLRGDGLKHFKKAALSEPTTTWFWEGWETCCLGNYKIVFYVLDPACNQTTEKIPPTTVVVTPSIDESVSGPRAPSSDDQTGNVHAFDKTQSMQNFHTRPTIRGFPGFYCQICHKTIIILSLNSSTHSIVPQVLCCVRLDALCCVISIVACMLSEDNRGLNNHLIYFNDYSSSAHIAELVDYLPRKCMNLLVVLCCGLNCYWHYDDRQANSRKNG